MIDILPGHNHIAVGMLIEVNKRSILLLLRLGLFLRQPIRSLRGSLGIEIGVRICNPAVGGLVDVWLVTVATHSDGVGVGKECGGR